VWHGQTERRLFSSRTLPAEARVVAVLPATSPVSVACLPPEFLRWPSSRRR